ncbi:TIGR02587 family membrane protein [bacterium]|nr:MAG: TIGR02587 family membrane protein [bacterium]
MSSSSSASQPSPRTLSQSAQEYGRGVAGGLLFSLPLLFTSEVWWAAFAIHPLRLLFYVLNVGILLVLYNRFAGLRPSASWTECAIDSVEEMGIGLLLAAGVLWLLGQLTLPLSSLELVGKVVMEGMTVALGVSIGTAQLGASSDDKAEEDNSEKDDDSIIAQIAIAFCGAILFVSNIAPTEEILMVALAAAPLKLLFIALLSLVLGGYLLYFAEFRGATQTQDRIEIARGVFSSYAIALIATAITLAFFGRFDGESLLTNINQTVVAGLAGSLGASGGRFLLQLNSNDSNSDSGDKHE